MKLTRIRAGDDGESHFEELDLPLDTTQRRATSASIAATQAAFGLSQALEPQDWHHAPRRQLVAVLSGTLEVEVGDGSTARFGPGDCFLADDLAGRGHLTRDLDGPVCLLYVHLPDDLSLEAWR
jgi:mannose-6-phosphate isomerase-like protein (cupin superfamily)